MQQIHIIRCLLSIALVLAGAVEPFSCLAQDPPPWQDVVVIPRPSPSPTQIPPAVTLGEVSRVVLYTTAFCDQCEVAVNFLKDRGTTYEERDLVTLQTLMSPLISGTNQPIFQIYYVNGGKRKVVGFDQALLDALIPGAKNSEFDLRNDERDSFDINGK